MEDVKSLTKEEFLKFLNCSHHSIQPETFWAAGPQNSKVKVVKRFGKYSACEVQLEECSLNQQVLRVPLPRINLTGLSSRQVALKFRTQKTEKKRRKNNFVVSRFGRKLKKKQLNIQSLTGTKPATRSLKQSLIKKSPDADKMTSWVAPVKQYPGPAAKKPQFIIKYIPTEPIYFLKMSPQRHPDDGKLKYSFDALVKDIKNMKLPSPTWKIKVVVKSNKIASIIFTNKCVLERTVSFNAKSDYYQMVIENRPAILLGSPNVVACVEDIEILLNIIHTISAKNPMVYYKN